MTSSERIGVIDYKNYSIGYRLINWENKSLPVVVFENGWGCSSEYWAWYMKSFRDKFRIIFFDRPGTGVSSSNINPFISQMLSNVNNILEHLDVEDKVYMIGHSYGGLIALCAALEYPKLFEKVFLLDPTPAIADRNIDSQIAMIKLCSKFTQLCALFNIKDPMYSGTISKLPIFAADMVWERSMCSIESLKSSALELSLLPDLRKVFYERNIGDIPGIYLFTAGASISDKSWFYSLFKINKKHSDSVNRLIDIHSRQSVMLGLGEHKVLDVLHADMVFSEVGAEETIKNIMARI